ncbi:protein DR_1172-like [Periplaneta americana]|uniref:protein DR_1172-like n=1 Tax=Periplaneta americana TaxID=6978 RepID=UPI0037E89A38
MAAKIVLSACVVLLVLQASCASVLLRRGLSDFINDSSSKLSLVETAAKNKIDEIINNLEKIVEQIKQQAQELAKKAAAIIQEIEDRAKQAVQNAIDIFDDLKQLIEDKVNDLKDKAEALGEGVKTCVANNEDKAKAIIQTAESDVQSCVSSVVATGKPLVTNLTEAVQKVTDLETIIASLVAKCLPSGASFVTALPCFALNSIPIIDDAKNDISVITQDVGEIIKLAPQLKTELDTCADQAKATATQVQQIIQDINSCVSDYMTSTAASA